MLAARETIFARDIVGMVWHQSGSIAASKCIPKVFMQLPIYPVDFIGRIWKYTIVTCSLIKNAFEQKQARV